MKSSSRLTIICERIIETGWLLTVILAPVFFNANTYRIFDADKIALVQMCVSLTGLAWIVKWIELRSFQVPWSRRILTSPLVLPTLAIIFIQVLTTLTAIAPGVSLIGSFTRPQGTTIVITYIAVFAMMVDGLTTRRQLDRLMVTIILASLPVAAYAIIQNFGFDPLVWDSEIPGRVYATLGNPIFLGAYLIIVFFLTLGKAVASINELGKRFIFQTGLYGLIALIQLLGILFTISRGPWVGWFAGVFFFALILAFVLQKRRVVQGILVLASLGILALVVLNIPNTPLEPIRKMPYVGSLGHIFEGDIGTGKYRTLVWEANARVFSERPVMQFPDGAPDRLSLIRPLVGYGPDSMTVIYTQLRIPNGDDSGTQEDHSHNETWDVLLNTGILGLIAYQWLWLSLFLLGLQYLGLMPTRQARNWFVGLWLGGGITLGIAAIALGQFKYFGVALPIGNLAGLSLFLTSAAWNWNPLPVVKNATRRILVAALVAALVAHYVEIQFGINLTTTHIMLWSMAAMLVALCSKSLSEFSTATVRRSFEWLGTAFSYAVIGATILIVLFFEFIQRTNGADLWQTLWLSLTFNPVSQQTLYAILILILGCWLTVILLTVAEMLSTGLARSNLKRTIGIIGIGSVLPAALFALGYSAQVSLLTTIPQQLKNLQEGIRIAEQFVGLNDFFYISLLIIFLLAVIALLVESNWKTLVWATRRWVLIAFAPLVLVTLFVANQLILTPIRADVYNKVGLFFTNSHETDAAAAVFGRAIRLAPMVDRYYMLLGNVYANKAFYLDMKNPSQFGDQTQLGDILNLDPERLSALNRNDAIYAAQTMYLHAYDLNPLYINHSVNLARLYKPEPPVDTAGKKKLAELSTKYYTRASRLAPSDMALWNEWADFDLTYWENADGALSKLNQAAQRDPKYAPTFSHIGDIYKTQGKLEQAATAYERALASPYPPAEAASSLAFTYYQLNELDLALQAYQRYTELAPDAPNLWQIHKNMALVYKQKGDMTQAVAQAQIAARLAPTDIAPQLNDLINQWQTQSIKP
ncbi:MAG: O-antigen ligase family protein [Chloroflexi bacterium]|nr:O-antigen ligase family protein [Chloroflexota bacterium]